MEVMAGFHDGGVRQMLHAIAEADLRPVLPTIDVPTLLLYGAEDARSPLPVAEAMHREIRGSELVVLPGCRTHEQPGSARSLQRRCARVPRREQRLNGRNRWDA